MPKREKNQWARQLVEVVRAIKLLSRERGASIEELVDELGVQKRAVQRLKRTLDEDFHLPLHEIDGIGEKCKRWHIPKTATIILPKVDTIGLDLSLIHI